MSLQRAAATQQLAPRRLDGRFALPLAAGAGVLGILKGLSPGIANGVDFYWMLDYRRGFVKRGLVGTLFHPVLTRMDLSRLNSVILGIHIVACLSIVYMFYRLFRRAVRQEESRDAVVTVMLAFLCLMCSPVMPSLAYIVGYMDVYIILVLLAAFSLVLEERYVAAALVASVGPPIHDAFVFLWSPLAIMLLWSSMAARRRTGGKLLAVGLPVLSAVSVAVFDRTDVAAAAIAGFPLPQAVRNAAIFQLQQTLATAFTHMMTLEYPGHLGNVAAAALFFLVPTAALLWSAGFLNWRRWGRHPLLTLLIAVAATAAPLALLAFAWDLSRFLAWSTIAATLVLIGLGSPALVGGVDTQSD